MMKFWSVILLGVITSCSTSVKETFWHGEISQDDNFALSNSYQSKLQLNFSGNDITGQGWYGITSDTSLYVLYSFEGYIENDTIKLKETGIIEAAEIKGEWYTKDIILYHPDGDLNRLEGSWVAHKNRDAGGFSRYSKAKTW